jgi:hypothetical protein
MADSMLDGKRKYDLEPSAAGQIGVTIKSMCEQLKYNPDHSNHNYTPKVMAVERPKTEKEKEIEEIARKCGLL